MWKGWVSGLCDGWGNWARTRFIGPPQCKDGVGGGGGRGRATFCSRRDTGLSINTLPGCNYRSHLGPLE